MKILQVVHDFLPNHAAGAEIYTYTLCKELAKRHDVLIFCTEHRPGFTQYAVREREYNGLAVVEMVNNHCLDAFEKTYNNPEADAAFERILNVCRPDVLHVQSLMYHSVNIPRIAKAAGLPIVHTMHDFWFQCEQEGKRLRPDGVRCDEVDPRVCSSCLATKPTIAGSLTQFAYQMALSFRWMSGLNLAEIAGRLRVPFARATAGTTPPWREDDSLVEQVAERNRVIREQFELIDRFLCPSAFMREELVRFGVPLERTALSGYGLDASLFDNIERKESEVVRFGFVGTPAPLKGVDLLLEAFRKVDPKRASLAIYGSLTVSPGFVKHLRRLAEGLNVSFLGTYEPHDVAAVFEELDVLVVPSIWFENQPLSIQEAFLAGVPVITSRLGGMAQSVADGESGLLFEPGNATDLAKKMNVLVKDREMIRRLAVGAPRVKTAEEDAAAVESIYRGLLNEPV